jgi:hypothetical protein
MNGCPWDKWTCIYAASEGHLEIFHWAQANGCPYPDHEDLDDDECLFSR